MKKYYRPTKAGPETETVSSTLKRTRYPRAIASSKLRDAAVN